MEYSNKPTSTIDSEATNYCNANNLPSECTRLLPSHDTRSLHGGTSSSVSMRVSFWRELTTLTRYAAPVFATGGLEYSLLIMPVVTIGHISTTALAAVTLGSMTANVSAFCIIQGLVSALDTLLPPAWTSAQPQLVGLWTQRTSVVVLISLVPMCITWINAEKLLLFLNQDPDVAYLAYIYLLWMLLGLPAYSFNCISRRYFQSQGLFTAPTRIIVCVAPLNALLNYLLVWGPSPVRLGFIGAPIATAISMNLISFLSIIYGVLYAPRTAWHPLSLRMFTNLNVVVRLGLSGVAQSASEWWAWELVALAASQLGSVALAAQSVLLVSSSWTYQAPYAISIATAVRIGNLLGEQKANQAGVVVRVSIFLTVIVSSFSSALFLVFRDKWAYIFNNDPSVVSLVSSVMPLLALFQVFDGLADVTGGILRAMGKQFIGALLSLSAYYILGIPIGLFCAFWLEMGLHGLWLGLTVSLVYAAIIGTWISICTDWNKQVERAMKRLEDDDKLTAAGDEYPDTDSERLSGNYPSYIYRETSCL